MNNNTKVELKSVSKLYTKREDHGKKSKACSRILQRKLLPLQNCVERAVKYAVQ